MSTFKDLEARTTMAAMKKTSNAIAVINGGDVAGIFNDPYASVNGIAGSNPMFTCAEAAVAADPRGLIAVIDGTSYRIADFQADGSGSISLDLEVA